MPDKERLESLNKARTKGPHGRRLPSTKVKKMRKDDLKSSDSNENIITDSCGDFTRRETGILEDTGIPFSSIGRITSQDFDKIWFLRVPSLPGDYPVIGGPEVSEEVQSTSQPPLAHSEEDASVVQYSDAREDDLSSSSSLLAVAAPDQEPSSSKSKRYRWKGKNLCVIL